jgi:exonuclease SbcC
MIPLYLTISGFLSYRDPVDIDFSSFSLACIAGRNGAGKSSILDAITWALFGQARKRDEAIINLQSETAQVVLAFEYEGLCYRVIRSNTRGKAVQLEFQLATNGYRPSMAGEPGLETGAWKTLSERTLRGTQLRIEETLRLDYETFINAAFFLQGKADQFTQQRPGDRKRILSTILGLDVWETYRLQAVERRKRYEAEIGSLDGRLAEIQAELAEEAERKASLAALELNLESLIQMRKSQETTLEHIQQISATLAEQRKLVDRLSHQWVATQERFQELEQRLASRQAEVANHTQILSRAAEIDQAYQDWLGARESLARWDEIAGQFRQHEKRREEPRLVIETERARLVLEMETLEERYTSVKQRQSSLADLQSELLKHQSQIDQLEAQLVDRKTLEAELQSATEILANARAENPRLKTEMDELKDRIVQLEGAEGVACPLCGQPLSPEERDNLIDTLNTLGKTMGDKYRENRVFLAEADQKVGDLKSRLARLGNLDEKNLREKEQAQKVQAQIEQAQTFLADWESQGGPRLAEINHILLEERFALQARAALADIDRELKEIGYDAVAHDEVREQERSGRSTESDLRDLARARAALEPLENEIANLEAQIGMLRTEIETQQAEYDQSAAHLAAAEAQAPDIHQAQRELLDIREQENRLRLEVGAAQQKVLVLKDLKVRRKKLEAEREGKARQVGQYKQLERAFSKDGVPALLIEQALPQIENKANELLERLSDGNMSVRFITQREYKDKKRDDLRETLDILISDSAGVRDYEMFSGGEAFRVNFAIRLALSEILAQRAGARLQTLVIDEGFGSQDEVGRQRLIEAINTVKPDFSKILVITHIDALKDAFPVRLEVEKTPRGSVVKVR